MPMQSSLPGKCRPRRALVPAPAPSLTALSALLCSPAFTFPHPINPVAYQQILSQQRGLGSAFGHTPPLLQPSPTFLAQQPMALTAITTTPTQLSSSSNCLSDASQVGGRGARGAGRAHRCSDSTRAGDPHLTLTTCRRTRGVGLARGAFCEEAT